MHRSNNQNRALHKYESELADHLNESGIDMRKIVRYGYDIPVTKENLHKMFNDVATVMFEKTSSELDSGQFSRVQKILEKTISERTGVHIDFPSMESLANKELLNSN